MSKKEVETMSEKLSQYTKPETTTPVTQVVEVNKLNNPGSFLEFETPPSTELFEQQTENTNFGYLKLTNRVPTLGV